MNRPSCIKSGILILIISTIFFVPCIAYDQTVPAVISTPYMKPELMASVMTTGVNDYMQQHGFPFWKVTLTGSFLEQRNGQFVTEIVQYRYTSELRDLIARAQNIDQIADSWPAFATVNGINMAVAVSRYEKMITLPGDSRSRTVFIVTLIESQNYRPPAICGEYAYTFIDLQQTPIAMPQ